MKRFAIFLQTVALLILGNVQFCELLCLWATEEDSFPLFSGLCPSHRLPVETPPSPLLPVCPSWCQTRRSCSNWLGERPTAARHAAQKHSKLSRFAAPSLKTQLSISHLTRQEWVSYRGNQHGGWTQSNAQWLIYLVLMGGTNSKLGLERLVPSLKSTSAGGGSEKRDPPPKKKTAFSSCSLAGGDV